jgi:N6-adenosine-specific RNA methylase IME4
MNEKKQSQPALLAKLEQDIKEYLVNGFVNVGLSLEKIRREKLYKESHDKWEDYYKDKFELSTSTAYRYIDGARVFQNLEKKQSKYGYKLPLYESQVRPLTKLKNEDLEAEYYNESFLLYGKRIPPANIIYRVVSEKTESVSNLENIETESAPNGLINLSQIKNKYSVILADPPWDYEFGLTKGVDPKNHYNTLSLFEMIDIGIQHIAKPNCLLFMWCTSPKLNEGLNLISKLGFTYTSAISWIKENASDIGIWVKSAPEHLLIAGQGITKKPEFDKRANGYISEIPTKHSAKPEAFYKIVEDLSCGYTDRIEIFARNFRKGWDAWGDEVGYHQCNQKKLNSSIVSE